LKINYPIRDFVPNEKLTHENFEDITRNGPIDPEFAERAIQTVKMALQVDKSFLNDGDNLVHPVTELVSTVFDVNGSGAMWHKSSINICKSRH
tara:strand:+ start:4308 stop:4586 length:279 start_codon:yes stop_codon:yes gene_type:complete